MVAWVFAVRWETKHNVELIKANGAMDSLHEGFHTLRLFYRIMAALAIVFTASLPLWHHDKAMGCSMVGLLLLFAGWFTWRFNPALNLARGKAEYYASIDPRAALFPDRMAVAVADRCVEKHGGARADYLPYAYEAILNLAFWFSIATYVGCMVGAFWLVIAK